MTATLPRPQFTDVTPQGELRLHFHAGQARAWQSERRFVFMLAGTQAGKTSFLPYWLHREIATQGEGDYLAVTSTFPLLKNKLLPEFLDLFQHRLHLGRWREADKVFQFHEGRTRVIFGSATHPESLESATAKAAVLDEAGQKEFRLESWQAILRRLSLHQGRVLAGTTIYNLGWMKQEIYDAWRGGDADIDVIQFASTLNPQFPPEELERARRSLPAWKFNMFYLGRYDRPAGLIYADYDDRYREEGGHKVRAFTLPPKWPRYGGLDFGAVNTARILVAHDPDADVYYAYDESLAGDLTTPEHVSAAKAATAGVNMVSWHGGSKSEVQQRLDWGAAGLFVHEPAVADVEAGIDRIIALFKSRRLYVVDTCRGLLDELGTYSRVPDANGNPTEEIQDKSTYHRLDALRYLGQALDVPPVRYVRNPWQ